MKTYSNGMKATEFSKKQISVVYGAAKRGDLKVERWMMSNLYDLADFYGYDDNRSVERDEKTILSIINAVFGKDMEQAQNLIDDYTNKTYELLGSKARKAANRSIVA